MSSLKKPWEFEIDEEGWVTLSPTLRLQTEQSVERGDEMKYELKDPRVRQIEVDGKHYLDVAVETYDCNGKPITFRAPRVSLQKADFRQDSDEMVIHGRPWHSPLSRTIRRKAYITLELDADEEGTAYIIEQHPVEMSVKELREYAAKTMGRQVILVDEDEDDCL